MKYIDELLNRITMFRVVVYGLTFLAAVSVAFAFIGRLSFTPTQLIVSLAVLLVSNYATDRLFGRAWSVPTNTESWLITALILFFVMPPANNLREYLLLILAGILANCSKFLLAYRGRHIFNPAAFAAAFLGLSGLLTSTWWIGSSALWPFALVVGLAVVRKIRRIPMVVTFVVASIALQFLQFVHESGSAHLTTGMKHALIASPLIFLATIMLTEPATMPPRMMFQLLFSLGIAVFYVAAPRVGPIIFYPEVALLLGNVGAFIVSPKFRVRLQLQEIQRVSDRVYNYVFRPDRQFKYLPGQYMEWTLAGVPYDSRGNRRSLTIASSPTETSIQIGLKYHTPPSAYKTTFASLKPGDTVYASQLQGDFTLNGNERSKLAFIAGGIGITPFRSMIKYLTDTKQRCDIILLYVVPDAAEFAYVRDLKAAATVGIRTIPIVTNLDYQADGVVTAKLNAKTISQLIPDYAERLFYISGPNTMVDATKGYLTDLRVPLTSIRTDHFSGY